MVLPSTIIAGISVPDTPLVKSAIIRAKAESPAWLFHHVMRSWLFAVKLSQFENVVLDEETLAVAAILHDLGLVPEHMTPERRFEADGAASAVTFLKEQYGEKEVNPTHSVDYYKHKIRELVVWDAIAMHTTPSIACHSGPEVRYCQRGIGFDIVGHGMECVPDAAATVEAILKEFPRLEIKREMTESLCAIARRKPETTYDNIVGAFGETYVEGYQRSKVGEAVVVASLRPS